MAGPEENCRSDGRSRNEFRDYLVVPGGLAMSNGSARIFLANGETDVFFSAKASVVVPPPASPRSGVVAIHVDILDGRDDQIEATLSRVLLPHLLDVHTLCIEANCFVWRIHLDIFVMASRGGSLLDVCSEGIEATLRGMRLPKVTVTPGTNGGKPTLQVDPDIAEARLIPGAAALPIVRTLSFPSYVFDATQAEETCAHAQIHMVILRTPEPVICSLHKTGGGALPFAMLQNVISVTLRDLKTWKISTPVLLNNNHNSRPMLKGALDTKG